jgi:integrase
MGALESAPKIELLKGERRRERVVTREEESRYLAAAASPLLASIATVLADTGLRPDECHRLRWEDITLGKWAQRHFARDARQDRRSKESSADDPESQRSARTALDGRWQALRGMGLACAHQDRPH